MRKFISTIAFAVTFFFSATVIAQESPTTPETYKSLMNFGSVFDILKKQYVDIKTDDELIDAAIRGMFQELDPHSTYMNAKMLKELQQHSKGELTGIGAHVAQDPTSKEIVIKPMTDGPAEKAGLNPGDKIVFVNDADVRELDLQTAVGLITGPPGTVVKLQIRHGDQPDLKLYEITRAKVVVPFIWSKVIEKNQENILYLKMMSFNMRSAQEVVDRVESMIGEVGGIENVDGIIFDVRFNGGGLLTAAIALSNMFMDEGLIVETRGRSQVPDQTFATSKVLVPTTVPMVVLINKFSASASEILSGTLGESGRAYIVGEKSYGKGSVQTTMPLPNGGGIKVTIAKYHTNGGNTPHGVGIFPDLPVELSENYWKERNFASDLIEEDPQLSQALDWLTCNTCQNLYYKSME